VVAASSASANERQSKRARRSRVEIVEEPYASLTIPVNNVKVKKCKIANFQKFQTTTERERNVETRGNSSISESNSKTSSGGNSTGLSSNNTNLKKQTKKKKRKAKQEKEQKQQKRQQHQDDSPQVQI